MLIVQKFGGSSLAGMERLRRAAAICLETRRQGHELIVVVSASGDSTDVLTDMARQISPSPPGRELAALMATGEQQSAALMAIMLESLGAAARSFTGWQAGIVTDPGPLDASPCLIMPQRLQESLDRGEIAVVAGFQGLAPGGDITTLNRGGSDTTALALAAAFRASRCEIYTDVDGIYTADPRLVTGARLLKEIDYRDMLSLALSGSQVLHPQSVRLAMTNGVELRLLSSFRKTAGTLVHAMPDESRPAYAGVTRSESQSTVSAVGKAAGPLTLSELVSLLGSAGIRTISGGIGENRVFLKVAQPQLLQALELVHSAVI